MCFAPNNNDNHDDTEEKTEEDSVGSEEEGGYRDLGNTMTIKKKPPAPLLYQAPVYCGRWGKSFNYHAHI